LLVVQAINSVPTRREIDTRAQNAVLVQCSSPLASSAKVWLTRAQSQPPASLDVIRCCLPGEVCCSACDLKICCQNEVSGVLGTDGSILVLDEQATLVAGSLVCCGYPPVAGSLVHALDQHEAVAGLLCSGFRVSGFQGLQALLFTPWTSTRLLPAYCYEASRACSLGLGAGLLPGCLQGLVHWGCEVEVPWLKAIKPSGVRGLGLTYSSPL